jgi:hypothetical protein
MSTKNLARTVIEGGRIGSSKYERRNSHNEERAAARDFCKRAVIDPESAEEFDIEPKTKAYKEFSDKLRPMYRWLAAQVGRPWKEVHSEIFKTFDTRTTAGRHITFDHLLPSIVDTNSGFDDRGYLANPDEETLANRKYHFSYIEYYVNDDGILCKTDSDYRTSRRLRYETLPEDKLIELGAWLNGRIISEKGGVLSWHTPAEGLWKSSWYPPDEPYDRYRNYGLKYYLFDNGYHPSRFSIGMYGFTTHTHGDFWNHIENPFSFRQRGPLSEEETKFFNELPMRVKKEILEYSKGR